VNRTRPGPILWLLASFCGLAFMAPPAQAFVPSAQRLNGGMIEANRSAKRNQSLRISFTLHEIKGSQNQTIGKGEILTNASGLSRLEIDFADGSRERHLLRGSQYLVSREGERVSDANPYLLPFPVLQAGDKETLQYAYRSLKVSPESSVLTRVDGNEAYRVGSASREDLSLDLAGGVGPGAIWLAVEGLYPLKMRLGQGSVYLLGQELNWGKIRVPSHIDLEGDIGVTHRIKIENIESSPAPAQVFTAEWLQFLGK